MATGIMTFTGLEVGLQLAPGFPVSWGKLEISFQGPISTATPGHTVAYYEPAGLHGDLVHLRTRPLWERQLPY